MISFRKADLIDKINKPQIHEGEVYLIYIYDDKAWFARSPTFFGPQNIVDKIKSILKDAGFDASNGTVNFKMTDDIADADVYTMIYDGLERNNFIVSEDKNTMDDDKIIIPYKVNL